MGNPSSSLQTQSTKQFGSTGFGRNAGQKPRVCACNKGKVRKTNWINMWCTAVAQVIQQVNMRTTTENDEIIKQANKENVCPLKQTTCGPWVAGSPRPPTCRTPQRRLPPLRRSPDTLGPPWRRISPRHLGLGRAKTIRRWLKIRTLEFS